VAQLLGALRGNTSLTALSLANNHVAPAPAAALRRALERNAASPSTRGSRRPTPGPCASSATTTRRRSRWLGGGAREKRASASRRGGQKERERRCHPPEREAERDRERGRRGVTHPSPPRYPATPLPDEVPAPRQAEAGRRKVASGRTGTRRGLPTDPSRLLGKSRGRGAGRTEPAPAAALHRRCLGAGESARRRRPRSVRQPAPPGV
jgi:hypothetical protein